MMEESEEQNEVETTYQLTIEGAGITVSRTVPEHVARAIIALVMGGPGVDAEPTGGGRRKSASSSGARRSIREYLNEVGAKRKADIITAMAKYLKEEGQESFTRDQIKDLFRKAREPTPSNYPRDFKDALSTGWIAEDSSSSGDYFITNTGEQAVADGFPGGIRRPAKRKTKKNGPDEGES